MQLDISFAPLCPSVSLDVKALHALVPLLSYRQIIFAYIIKGLHLLIVCLKPFANRMQHNIRIYQLLPLPYH